MNIERDTKKAKLMYQKFGIDVDEALNKTKELSSIHALLARG